MELLYVLVVPVVLGLFGLAIYLVKKFFGYKAIRNPLLPVVLAFGVVILLLLDAGGSETGSSKWVAVWKVFVVAT